MSNFKGKYSASQKIYYVVYPEIGGLKDKTQYFFNKKEAIDFVRNFLNNLELKENEDWKDILQKFFIEIWSCYLDGRSKKAVLLEVLNGNKDAILLKKKLEKNMLIGTTKND